MTPFDSRAQVELTQSVQHVHTVWAYDKNITPYAPVQLDLVSATLNYDESRAPFALLTGSLQVPDQTLLDFLDPRRDIRIFVMAGYVYDDGTEDIWNIVDLGLRSRVVRRPQNDLVITAASDEMRIQDYVSTRTYTFTQNSDGGQAIRQLILDSVGATTPVLVNMTQRPFVDSEPLVILPGTGIWETIQMIADRIGAWVYHDGQGTFYVVPQPTTSGAAMAALRVGKGGSITGSESVLDRADFANFVLVEYAGGSAPVHGWAEVKSGNYGSTAIGRKGIAVSLPNTGTSAQATAAASSMLWRAMSRGRSMSLEVAQAMYWLRPGQTVTVQLQTGPQERHLVASIEFDIPTGTMNVKTRQPENVAITTGE